MRKHVRTERVREWFGAALALIMCLAVLGTLLNDADQMDISRWPSAIVPALLLLGGLALWVRARGDRRAAAQLAAVEEQAGDAMADAPGVVAVAYDAPLAHGGVTGHLAVGRAGALVAMATLDPLIGAEGDPDEAVAELAGYGQKVAGFLGAPVAPVLCDPLEAGAPRQVGGVTVCAPQDLPAVVARAVGEGPLDADAARSAAAEAAGGALASTPG